MNSEITSSIPEVTYVRAEGCVFLMRTPDMKFIDYIKAFFYLVILMVAIAALKLLEGIGKQTSSDQVEIVWQDEFEAKESEKSYWYGKSKVKSLSDGGIFRSDTSAFMMLLNLPAIKKDLTSSLDSGFLEVKVKLPLDSKIDFYHIDLWRDTSLIQVPKGLHSEYIKLRSDNFSFQKMGTLVIQGTPIEKKFDIVDSALKLIEDEGFLLDYVRLYGIKE